jgi:hypothetical protein
MSLRTYLLIAFLIGTSNCLYAQVKPAHRTVEKSADSVRAVADTAHIQQKDLYDVISQTFGKHKDKKATPKKDSVTSKPTYSVLPAAGYTLVSKFVVTLTGNTAFRMDSTADISTVTAYVSYTQNKQFLLPIQSDLWTKNNKYNLVGDIRFYKYPQSTFGLGSSSNMANEDPMDYLYFRFYETVLRKVVGNFFAGAGYIIDYHTDITQQGTVNGTPSGYTAYGAQSTTVASGLTLNGLYDTRDNSIYPEKGFYSAVQYRDNFDFLGSTQGWTSLIVDVRQYFRLPANSNNVLALWSYDWLILSGKPGYLDLPSNQWDAYSSTGRGYIQGRFRGTHEVYGEAEYRFVVTENGLVGGVLFLNGQSYSAGPGTRLQAIQPGFGPGLRLKINKISKTNIDFDYGFGREGSRGLFINIGEVF